MKKKDYVQIYSRLLAEYEHGIQNIENLHDKNCSCKKGCSYCCKQIIIISDFEKKILTQVIKKMPFKQRKELWKRTKAICSKLLENNILPQTILFNLEPEKQKQIQLKYFSMQLPCLFENYDKSCMIYTYRPVSCMTFRSYGKQSLCMDTPFAKDTITYNDIEFELRKELFEKTGKKFDGINMLPYAVFDVMKRQRWFYEHF